MDRRHFMIGSAAVMGSVLLSQCSRGTTSQTQSGVVTSAAGLLEVSLTARVERVRLGQQSATLMAYNGQVPGPRLESRPGDRVRIHFHNQLATPSNLHFHGLHITPGGSGDNVFVSVQPGESFTYEFTIPADHPGGTFWYHPHHHGQVADQVAGGLVGLFIVRSDLDEVPEIQSATETFLVLQDFELDRQGQLVPPPPRWQMWGREGSLLVVNGQFQPKLALPSGGLLRLRVLNASPSRFYRLALEDHLLHLIATDGGALAAPVELSELVLAPGERAEVLVQGNQPAGTYRLLTLPYDRGLDSMLGGLSDGMEGGRPYGSDLVAVNQTPQTLAIATYPQSPDTPATPQASLPAQLLPIAELPEPIQVRQFVLDHGIDFETGMAFLINGKAFAHHRIDTQVIQNTVEDWVITNRAGMNHPFHVHVNAFQVVSRNGTPPAYRAWKDTINIAGGETVRIRIPFRDFSGQTVYHCHILDHEDRGMMGILEIA
jgi:FtsP/CotA-like multicopper oxidase with cupredoxin domain